MGIRACDDFDDRAFGATAAIQTGDTHLHPIAVQNLLQLFFRQKNIFAIIRDQETITIPMRRNPALDETRRIGELDAAFAVRLNLTIALHGSQSARQTVKFDVFDRKRLGDGGKCLRVCGCAQNAQDFFPAGDAVRGLAQKICVSV